MNLFGDKTELIILQDIACDLKRLRKSASATHGCGAPKRQAEIQSIMSSGKPRLGVTCFAS